MYRTAALPVLAGLAVVEGVGTHGTTTRILPCQGCMIFKAFFLQLFALNCCVQVVQSHTTLCTLGGLNPQRA